MHIVCFVFQIEENIPYDDNGAVARFAYTKLRKLERERRERILTEVKGGDCHVAP